MSDSSSLNDVRKLERRSAAQIITDADGWPVTFRRLADTVVMQTEGARFTPEDLRAMAQVCLRAAEEIERDQAMRGTVPRRAAFGTL